MASHRLLILLMISVLISLASCKKTTETLKGSITGKISSDDAGWNVYDTLTGASISLLRDQSLIASDISKAGSFTLENILYGRYNLLIEKNGYVPYSSVVEHIGGYSPTIVHPFLYEIPKIKITLDSAVEAMDIYQTLELKLYLRISGIQVKPYLGYKLLCFFSNQTGTDADHYTTVTTAVVLKEDISGEIATSWVVNNDAYNLLRSDTIYARLYPVPWSESEYDFHKQYFGKPSNVLAFLLKP
jgi:hypothetical protein